MVRAKSQLNAPGSGLAAADGLARPLWLFVYGDAVECLAADPSFWAARAGQPGVDLAYCTTAWARRGLPAPPSAAEGSSLLQYWTRQIACWQAQQPLAEEDQAVTIRFEAAQDELAWRESLELILAAATLDLTVHVEVAAPAWRSLRAAPGQRQAWQQLLDFELAAIEVQGEAADPDEEGRGVRFRPAAAGDAAAGGPWRLLA